MESPTIYIIGAGAIGKALAVFLQEEHKDVMLIRGSVDHQPATEALVTVSTPDKKYQQKIKTTTFSHISEINGIVLITTKTFANTDIAQKLKSIKGNYSIVLLQNGLNIEKAFDTFEEVYRCVLFSTSQLTDEHHVNFKPVTASPIGKIEGEAANLESIVAQINTPHFGFRREANILKYVWDKVIINCAFNSICPLLEIDNGIFHSSPEATVLATTIIGECVALAQKYGVALDAKEIEEKLLLISQRAEGQLISTYEDIRKKRSTEIESLNLEVARLAEEIGMPELVTHTRLLGEMIRIKSSIYLS